MIKLIHSQKKKDLIGFLFEPVQNSEEERFLCGFLRDNTRSIGITKDGSRVVLSSNNGSADFATKNPEEFLLLSDRKLKLHRLSEETVECAFLAEGRDNEECTFSNLSDSTLRVL